MESNPKRGMQKLHALGDEVNETLDDIRTLARGIYPALLGDRGLAEALRAAALRSPIAARVEPDGVGRYPQDVESAVYFCCLEAIQNASKHARGARAITITLRQDHALRFQVRDDGAGFDSPAATPGAGLTNMRDRLVAVGGEPTIRSSSGGTVVTGSVPASGTRRERGNARSGCPRLPGGERVLRPPAGKLDPILSPAQGWIAIRARVASASVVATPVSPRTHAVPTAGSPAWERARATSRCLDARAPPSKPCPLRCEQRPSGRVTVLRSAHRWLTGPAVFCPLRCVLRFPRDGTRFRRAWPASPARAPRRAAAPAR